MSDFWFVLGCSVAVVVSWFYFYTKGVNKGYREYDWFYDREQEAYKKQREEQQEMIEELEAEANDMKSEANELKKYLSQLQIELAQKDERIKDWKSCCDDRTNMIEKMSEDNGLIKDKARSAAKILEEFL